MFCRFIFSIAIPVPAQRAIISTVFVSGLRFWFRYRAMVPAVDTAVRWGVVFLGRHGDVRGCQRPPFRPVFAPTGQNCCCSRSWPAQNCRAGLIPRRGVLAQHQLCIGGRGYNHGVPSAPPRQKPFTSYQSVYGPRRAVARASGAAPR
jgi:hypothetical protein